MKPAQIRFSLQRPPQHTDPVMAPTITAALTNSEEHLTLSHKVNGRFKNIQICWMRGCLCSRWLLNHFIHDVILLPVAQKASGGEVTQRANQQQHWAAQVSPGSRVPQTAARLQAGESRHPGDDSLCPETTAAAEKTDGALQQAAVFLWWRPDRGWLLSSELHGPKKDHQRAGSSQQRPLEAVVDTYRLQLLADKLRWAYWSKITGLNSLTCDGLVLLDVQKMYFVCVSVCKMIFPEEMTATISLEFTKRTSCHACCMNPIWCISND